MALDLTINHRPEKHWRYEIKIVVEKQTTQFPLVKHNDDVKRLTFLQVFASDTQTRIQPYTQRQTE